MALASDIALIPGRVGLAVLEMASAGLPLATLADSLHGAEIAYLKDGINGLLLSRDIDTAAGRLAALLADRPTMERMRNEALMTAEKYTIRSMAVNFADGVNDKPLAACHGLRRRASEDVGTEARIQLERERTVRAARSRL